MVTSDGVYLLQKMNKLSKEILVQKFSEAAIKHHQATIAGNYKVTNREAKKISQAAHQLKNMGDEGYQALMPLLKNDNKVIASSAAAFLLKYATKEAQDVLKNIAQNSGLIGFEAKQALDRWQEGDWHLDE